MVEKETKEVKEKEIKAVYEVKQVPTQMGLVIRNNSNGEEMSDIFEISALILNELQLIKKSIA